MYHTRKIGVFVSHIFGLYQTNVCQGIIDKASEYGYTTEIFTSIDGENLGAYGIREDSVLRIPNFDSLDGVIFATGTYLSTDLREKIINQLLNCSCPVVEFPIDDPHFPGIVLENNINTTELVEHFATVHHFKRICFMGCAVETSISNIREQYYRQTMEKNNLAIGEHDIYHCDYTKESITEALDFFLQDGIPQSIICYNDRMALTFMETALSRGFRIPDDIAISGFDNSAEGYHVSPMLTTVSFPVYELGITAVETLISKIRGNDIPKNTLVNAKTLVRNSCGCKTKQDNQIAILTEQLTEQISNLESSIFNSIKMSSTLQHITDIDEGMDLLEEYIHNIEHCKEVYICLYSDWNSISNHILELTDTSPEQMPNDTILLKFGFRNGKRLPECSYRKNSLLPEYIYEASGSAYLYTPLFFGEKEFGYLALSFENNRISYPFQLIQWQMNINQMLQSICEARQTGLLVAKLEEIYMKDALTGLLNKHGYNHYEEPLLARSIAQHKYISAFLIDMNGLKKINDNFGHLEGDFAIQVMGHALESTTDSDDICARFSGDEFYILSYNRDENDARALIMKIHAYLENYNTLSNKEYSVSCSCGFASALPGPDFTSENIQELFTQADKMMYKNKSRYHSEH